MREQLQKTLMKLDAEGMINILDKINPRILGENRDLKAEILLMKLYKLIRDKRDPAEVLEFASGTVTTEIKNTVRN